jgi:hypothetical protein
MLSTGKAAGARVRGLRLISQIILAVQILSFGHLLSSSHVTCPEHGDIIHVQRGESAEARKLDAVAGETVLDSMAATESASDADHDSCLACVDANRRNLVMGATLPIVAHQVLVRLVHAARSAFFSPVELILLSPKNSPPLA